MHTVITIICCVYFLLSGHPAFGDTSSELTRLNGEYRKAASLAMEGKNADAIESLNAIIASTEKLRSGLPSLPAAVTGVERTALSEEIARLNAKSERALSTLYHQNGDYQAVQLHFKKGIETLALFGSTEDNENLAADYKYFGTICETNKDYMEAASCYDTALRLKAQHLGANSKELIGPLKDLIRLMKRLEQYEAARNFEARLRKIELTSEKP